jgi:nucleolar protein 14
MSITASGGSSSHRLVGSEKPWQHFSERNRWLGICCASQSRNRFTGFKAMPPSQLKQLKTSLRDQGLVGPQKSKKQKKLAAKDAGQRQKRTAALQSIRERFNPFEIKLPARKEKFLVVSVKDVRAAKGVQGRPGVTKGLGEERRRATFLKEIQSRNRVGQIVDRRFGENDPTMTPEQRAAERFARQSERQLKKRSMFNLEDEADNNVQLTHMGHSLTFGEGDTQDDFKEENFSPSDGGSDELEGESRSENFERPLKRRRLSDDEGAENQKDENSDLLERKKSKQEVMREVIAKAKLHKYERQQAKEDDDDLRAELDKGLSDFLDSMQSLRKSPPPSRAVEDSVPIMNPDRAALLAGEDRQKADQEYNERVLQMAMDKRSKPSTRTKTDEEKAGEEAGRLRDLEAERLRRMQGAAEGSDEENEQAAQILDDLEQDDAEAFGLGQAANGFKKRSSLDVEDEDDFVLDDDLIASDSELDLAAEDDEASGEESAIEDDGDDDFINGLVLPPDTAFHKTNSLNGSPGRSLSFTYPCPTTHEEFLSILQDTSVDDVPTVVQRIRALYHPKLSAGNKAKLEAFAAVLTQHVAYLADKESHAPNGVLESLLRHLHSLAKSHPSAIAAAIRTRLKDIADSRPLELRPGDFIILTGISTVFPTSDHFHSVVTPASLTIAQFLGQSRRLTLMQLVQGAYCCTLALQYQNFSKRFIPEVMTYIQQALALLTGAARTRTESLIRNPMPHSSSLELSDGAAEPFASLRFENVYAKVPTSSSDTAVDNRLKATLISHFLTLLDQAAETWQHKSAFPEIFEPASLLLEALLQKHEDSLPNVSPPNNTNRHPSTPPHHQHHPLHTNLTTQALSLFTKITSLRLASLSNRLPLLLHLHRPLAIKTSIPKFEEAYNPDRHYDPDRERSQLNKLRAEHKRERKGAMRELRRDANFIARQQLREKKERDQAYERKFRRLVAEIQGEEGHEGKVYEREKARRRGRGSSGKG